MDRTNDNHGGPTPGLEVLKQIADRLHDHDQLFDALPQVESAALTLLNAERMTVYQRGRSDREIVSRFKSGGDSQEIRVPLTTSSIAGFVALSQKSLRICDVYEQSELETLHPNLRFNKSWDQKSGFRSRQMIALPIRSGEVLLGVLQLLNHREGRPFSDIEFGMAEELAKLFGQKLRYEFKGTRGPYDLLVQNKLIKSELIQDFTARAERERTSIIALLLGEASITKEQIGQSLERYYQVPFQPFDPSIVVPRELLKGINDQYLLNQLWVPVAADGNQVTVVIDNPSDTNRIMEIHRLLPYKSYAFKVGLPDDIRRFLGQNATTPEVTANVHELLGKLAEESADAEEEAIEFVDENAATVIQLVNRLIFEAYEARASDIHIEPGKGKANASVRIRVDGACRPSLSIPASHIQAVVSRIKIISGLDISERRKPQDGKCMLRFRGSPVELRVATLPTVHGESVVMRILASSDPLPLDKLNLSDSNSVRLKQLATHPHGILLVVGPTGSGKTTTLHAVLGHLNTPDRKIWTAEDPVEITQPGLCQVQMQSKIGLTFAAALRAFLRADPDVIMIGEMRDHETAHAGIEASLTGHLVLSTLHTNSAPETVVRLLDLGLDPVNFADALLGVLAQRLVRTLCSGCKEQYPMTEEDHAALVHLYGEEHSAELGIKVGETMLYRACGCEKCGNSGYRGRTGVHELLTATPEMKSMICARGTAAEIRNLALEQGMRTLLQDGIRKLLKGDTDLSNLRKVAA